jgi:hypothetical protein
MTEYAAVLASVMLALFATWMLTADDPDFLRGMLLGFAALFIFGVTAVWAAVYFLLNIRAWRRSARPLMICALALIIVVTIPSILWLGIKYDFDSNREARERVVARVKAGQLGYDAKRRVRIPLNPSEKSLSQGGEIDVEKRANGIYVFFFISDKNQRNRSGFLSVPANGRPFDYSNLSDRETEYTEMAEGWFYAKETLSWP